MNSSRTARQWGVTLREFNAQAALMRAMVAELFSFRTNGLMQMTIGFSGAAAGKSLPDYLKSGICEPG